MGKRLKQDLEEFDKVIRCLDERSKFEGWYLTKEYYKEWRYWYRKILLLKKGEKKPGE